ncbi:RNA polymerase sigma-70 factor [Saccharicrinis sp. FJH62]|uniref:RNA polymerase sigma-70 factor n=1 Tax=Saccharicrinis sp. FJH62 TaxID=3344657 RepID=UPI0035D4F537
MTTKGTGNIEQELIRRLKRGDEYAYRQIYDAFSENLFHFAFSYLKNTFESEEIVQDVFMRIWEMREEIDEEKSFKSFLYRMTVNKVLNHIKHQVVKQKYECYLQNVNQSFNDNPEADLHFKELNTKIKTLLVKLPGQQQNIFKMSRVDGNSNSQIAEELGLSIRTVENQIYRATKFLKENLKDEYLIVGLLILLLGGVM